jgi:hypothetical protein
LSVKRKSQIQEGTEMKPTLIVACLGLLSVAATGGATAQTTNFTVIASGLDGPRGMKFGPDGNLYVAEAGIGGPNTTVGECTQVPAPYGPYGGGDTARISMIRPDGTRTIVADHLPSTHTAPPFDAASDGVADVAFIDNELYALISGGGCSHGNPDTPASVIKVDCAAGTWTQVADLSEWVMTHPAAVIQPDDFEPDETFYSMIALKKKLYVVGPNHGQVIEVEGNGKIRQLIDISASQGHIVPTAITFHDGNFQVGNLGTFESAAGTSLVLDISRAGKILDSTDGFTAVVGLAYHHERLYVLQLASPLGSTLTGDFAGTGKVVRVDPSGAIEDVVVGLTAPTAMTFDPEGNLFIANFGTFFPGAGQIIEVAAHELESSEEDASR